MTRPARPAALDPADPIAQLNEGFREAYAARRQAVLAELGPALAQIEDSLFLRIDGRRLVGPARTRRYHELKTICHVPLAIQAIVGDAGGPIDDEVRGRLVELQRRADDVLPGIDERGLEESRAERQRRILTAARDFIAAALRAGEVERARLEAFLRGQMPDIGVNLEDATRDQLQTTHATFGAWVRDMRAEDWSRLLVCVGSSHMARTGNVAAQYFSLALGDRWEGRFEREDEDADRRVLTAEGVADEEAAFMLLAMHVFDGRAANAFFGEQSRLGRDVLAEATERQLGEMFGERPRRRPTGRP